MKQIMRIPLDKTTPVPEIPWLRKALMPKGAEVLGFQVLANGPSFWMLCDEKAEPETRFFALLRGNEKLPDSFTLKDGTCTHYGTQAFQMASMPPGHLTVLHFFEVSPAVALAPTIIIPG